MEQFKNANVVMLATENNYQGIYLSPVPSINKIHYWDKRISNSYIAQHLYITSSNEISSGEENVWYFDSNFNKVTKWIGESDTYVNKWFKKIIATTDKSLTIDEKTGVIDESNGVEEIIKHYLPQPPKEWIEHFIGEYNSSRIIKEILIEYNEPCCKCDTSEKVINCLYNVGDVEGSCSAPNLNNDFYGLNIKINSDNTINIKF